MVDSNGCQGMGQNQEFPVRLRKGIPYGSHIRFHRNEEPEF